MKILSFDLGTKTGWCLGEHDAVTPQYGTIVLAKPKEITQFGKDRRSRTEDPRVMRLYRWTRELCEKEQPNIVVWEDVQFSTYTFQTQLWSSLRTSIQLAARAAHSREAPMIFECVNVTTLKMFATSHGGATKDRMLHALKIRGGFDLSGCDDNTIDAIWLWKWAQQNLARTFKK